MLRKLLSSCTLLLALGMPAVATPAHADQADFGLRHEVRSWNPYHHRSAWDVVSRDPCLSEQYRRFAAEHRNPNKRQRFIERLAREGDRCPRRRYSSDYDYAPQPRYDGSYRYYNDRYDVTPQRPTTELYYR